MGVAKSKTYFQKKAEIQKGREGSELRNSEGVGGNTFWNFQRQGGLKQGSRLWLGMDIFWNCPMSINEYG